MKKITGIVGMAFLAIILYSVMSTKKNNGGQLPLGTDNSVTNNTLRVSGLKGSL